VELEALPGICPTLAAAIVEERQRNGPFRSANDLTRVHGIGPGRLAQLRDFVAF
jgi:competence protein ComEA